MRAYCVLSMAWVLSISSSLAVAQRADKQEREEEFLAAKPLVGDLLPEVTVYSPTGTAFKTADLRGHYTVLTFGCLT